MAAALVSAMFPGPMSVATTLSHGTSVVQGLFIEMFLTALLVITILMLAVEKSKTTFMAPVGIGLALFVAHLTGMLSILGCISSSNSPHVLKPTLANRSLLHRRLSKSYPFLRPSCCNGLVSWIPLDLLARTGPRRLPCIRLLSPHQVFAL